MPAQTDEFDFSRFPDKLSDLPKVDGQPQGCAWGLFDQEGKRDELGCESVIQSSPESILILSLAHQA